MQPRRKVNPKKWEGVNKSEHKGYAKTAQGR
jgi:hypothetical protein